MAARLKARWGGALRTPVGAIAAVLVAAVLLLAVVAPMLWFDRADAIDTAMQLGTNWPEGPLAWGERIGLGSVVHTLDSLHASVPDGRYRVVPLLRTLAADNGSFFAARE